MSVPNIRPNLLFVMSDDHAAHAISAYGNSVNQTPNIDRIAREGARLDRVFCTNSICTPSRATRPLPVEGPAAPTSSRPT